MARDDGGARWLLLIHQIPPQPGYFRAKVGRRLARMGAVAIKNSVYVAPRIESAQEDLQWLAREIVQDGGEATICAAGFIEGLRDDQVEQLFHVARDAEYAQVAEEARDLLARVPSAKRRVVDEARAGLEADLARVRKRLGEIVSIDFFGAPGRQIAESAVTMLEERVTRGRPEPATDGRPNPRAYKKRTWVTRKNIHVDRIACAWLIKRFIDPEATFRFVVGQGYKARKGEVTFDMFEADFTHVGDRCSFEVLVDAFVLRDPGLGPIAEIVHEIDVKDGKFARDEVPGVASLIAGLAVLHREDEKRVEVGSAIFEALFELYRRRRGHVERTQERPEREPRSR
jgi:hypothetical protein